MKKIIFVMVAVLVIFATIPAFAVDMKKPVGQLYVPYADKLPTFDGKITEEEWGNAVKASITSLNCKAIVNLGGFEVPEDFKADMYMMWNETHLFVAFDVTDPTPVSWTEWAWDGGDAIQFLVDGGNVLRGITCLDTDKVGISSGPIYAMGPQVKADGSDGAPLWLHQRVPEEAVITDYETHPAAATASEHGWTFECGITWELIAQDMMTKSGLEMGEIKAGFEFSALVVYQDLFSHSGPQYFYATSKKGYETDFVWDTDEYGINATLLGTGEKAPETETEPETSELAESETQPSVATDNSEGTTSVETKPITTENKNAAETDDVEEPSIKKTNMITGIVLLSVGIVLLAVAIILILNAKKVPGFVCLILAVILCAVSIPMFLGASLGGRPSDSKPDDVTEGPSDGRYHAAVPSKDYDGATFTIMCRDPEMGWGEMAIVSTTQEDALTVLDNATYNRNQRVMEDFHINLEFKTFNDANSSGDLFYAAINETNLSGDSICDICIPGAIDAATLTSTGVFYNLDSVPYVDLEQPWWQKSLNDSMRLLNKQYFAINDSLLNDKQDTYVFFFNKDMFDDIGMDYPYALVDSGSWTIDRFSEMIRNYGSDLNQNNVADYEDKYGFVGFIYDVFYVGSGYTAAYLDKDGLPVMREMDQKMQSIFEKTKSIVVGGNAWDTYSVGQETLYNNSIDGTFRIAYDEKSLFTCGPLGFYFSLISDIVSDSGMVPVPKYDESQTRYYHRAGYNGSTVITILRTTSDIERSGIILEAFSAESKNYISPAYYDKLLTNRYAQDEDSKRMISLVIDTEVFDLDQIFRWGAMLETLQGMLGNGNSTSAAGVYARLLTGAKTKCQTTVDKYLQLGK